MPTEHKSRKEIVAFGKMLYERGYVAAMDGNLSVRMDERRVLATPTAMCKGMMRSSDMVIVDLDGNQLAGRRHVSSEIGMHLLIYRLRPDIRSVVHAHPPTATGFAAAGIALNKPLVCEVVIGLGSIPLAKYGTPGTPELAGALEPLIPDYDAILMSNHGVVAYGDSLEHAYMKMETVEHFAKNRARHSCDRKTAAACRGRIGKACAGAQQVRRIEGFFPSHRTFLSPVVRRPGIGHETF